MYNWVVYLTQPATGNKLGIVPWCRIPVIGLCADPNKTIEAEFRRVTEELAARARLVTSLTGQVQTQAMTSMYTAGGHVVSLRRVAEKVADFLTIIERKKKNTGFTRVKMQCNLATKCLEDWLKAYIVFEQVFHGPGIDGGGGGGIHTPYDVANQAPDIGTADISVQLSGGAVVMPAVPQGVPTAATTAPRRVAAAPEKVRASWIPA